MYEAGSAYVILGARVLPEGFQGYGRLVEEAKLQKEHMVQLGAHTSKAGFEQWNLQLDRVKKNLNEFVYRAKGSWDEVTAATTRMVAASDREMGTMRRSLGLTADSYSGVSNSARAAARTVIDDQGRMAAAAREGAAAQRTAADSVIRSNEQIAASAGGAGRGSGGGVLAAAAGNPEAQAKKATAAWKDGFNTLANIGKWTSLLFAGTGVVAVKMAADFQKQMELVHTQAGYSQVEVERLKRSVLSLAPAVGIGPTKLAEGLFHIASSGIPAAKAMNVLKIAAEGAKVGNADMEHVTNALVAILRTAPKDIHSTAEAMGVLNDIVGHGNMRMEDLTGALSTGLLPAAKAVGLTLRDVGAALDVLTSRGVPAQEGATRLRTVLGLIANPTTKAQKALDELGFSQDRLARDFRSKGLTGALQDLQTSMDHIYGHPLSKSQELQALTAYAQRLKDSGVSANTATKDLQAFKMQLDKNGEGAIHSSQLIAQAFGGARMGTTMQILMQNIGDVRKHFDELNKAGAAQRFQNDWKDAQKTFSEEAAKLWANVQVLAIGLGNFLIPKVEALVKALIEAGKWLGHHEALAKALAYAFGTLLVGAIVAFFTRFLIRIGEGVKAIGGFGKAIYDLPMKMGEATAKMSASLARQRDELRAVEEQAVATGDAVAGIGAESAGVAGAAAGAAPTSGGGGVGPLLGLLSGVRGTEAPGSRLNPLAVVVLAGESFGLSGSQIGGRAASGRGVVLPSGVDARGIESAEAAGGTVIQNDIERGAAAGGKVMASEVEAGAGAGGKLAGAEMAAGGKIASTEMATVAEASSLSLVGRLKSGLLSGGSSILGVASELGPRLLKSGIGLLLAQSISSFIPGALGHALSKVATGAAIGSFFGPWGTAFGAVLGGALAIFTNNGKSDGEKWADKFTSTLPGKISDATKKGLAAAGNQYIPPQPTQTPKDPAGSGPSVPALSVSAAAVQRAELNVHFRPSAESKKELADAIGFYRHEFNTQFQAMFKPAFDYGYKAGNSWVEGMKHVKFPTTFGITGSIEAQLKAIPDNIRKAGPAAIRVWQDTAAKQMLQYASSLEQHGKLPIGAVDRMIATLEQQFPSLGSFLARQGLNNEKFIAQHMKFDEAQKNLKNALNNMRDQWGLQWSFTKTTNKNIFENTGTAMKDLQVLMKDKNKKIREEAHAEWEFLRKQTHNTFVGMVNDVSNKSSQMADWVKKGTQSAYQSGSANWQLLTKNVGKAVAAQVLTVGEGQKIIDDALNKQLKAFGEQPLSNDQIAHLGPAITQAVASGQVSSGAAASKHATGGILPGREYGYGDAMTLVDPQGRPRAKMAGDEAIFNRHQQPYVEMGLRAIGFNGMDDLWSQVNRPHGYESGGKLPGFAVGGGLGNVGAQANSGASTGKYVFPFSGSGWAWSRTDQGVDFGGNAPVGAIGDARVTYSNPSDGWYAPAPAFMVYQLLAGPDAGKDIYVAEHLSGMAPAGTTVTAGKAIAQMTGGIEMGWAAGPQGHQIILPMGANHLTTAGTDFHNFLIGLTHGQIVGGAFGGAPAPTFKDISPPKVEGSGPLVNIAQGVLNKATTAANKFGQKRAAAAGGNAFSGSLSGPVEQQVYQFFSANGFNKVAIAGMLGNALQESTMNPNLAGGGLWQQISNFGSGSGGSLLNQMQTMLPQIQGIKGALNASGSPAAAATLFMNSFERPNAALANLPRRIQGANAAFAAGYAGGGKLGGDALPAFASGGHHTPKAVTLPRIPSVAGYRPPTLRRTKHGFTLTHPSKGSGSRSRGGSHHSLSSGPHRTHTPINQSTAGVLKLLGLSSFVTDQNMLGTLDNQYNMQETLFNTFDAGSAGLPLADLDILQGIREQEWNILFKEWKQLPGAIAKLTKYVNHLEGTPVPGHWRPGDFRKGSKDTITTIGHLLGVDTFHGKSGHGAWGGMSTGGWETSSPWGRHQGQEWVPGTPASGVSKLTGEIAQTEKSIADLGQELKKDSRAITTVHHNVTKEAMKQADIFAQQTAQLTDDLYYIHLQRLSNARERNRLHGQELNSTGGSHHKSSTSFNPGALAQQVLSGATGGVPSSSSGGSNIAIRRRLNALTGQDNGLSVTSAKIHKALHDLTLKRQAEARKLRQHGFDEAWKLTLLKWRLEDKVTRLKDVLAKLKAELKIEESFLKPAQAALTQVQGWLTGGLQGNQSILQSLGDIGMDMLTLYQQGADLPTPGDKPILHKNKPTLKGIEKLLSDPPPKGLGLIIPGGITGGGVLSGAAAQADFANFQASQAALFSQFGSNFVPAGRSPFPGAAGISAGVQYYGAASGSSGGAGSPGGPLLYPPVPPPHWVSGNGTSWPNNGPWPGSFSGGGQLSPGGTTINIEQHFGGGPPDPHTYAAGLNHEISAQV